MTDSSSFTFKKNHVYIFAGILIALFAVLIPRESDGNSGTESQVPIPTPTKTVLVPIQGNNNSWNDDTQNQLDELRAQNCRLSQDLLLQSLDLSRQADDLDWASEGFDNFDRIQELRNQSLNLLLKSQELANDC